MGSYITFSSIDEAENFKSCFPDLIKKTRLIASCYEGVSYTETWLCFNCPSHVVGFNKHDEILVSVPILVPEVIQKI